MKNLFNSTTIKKMELKNRFFRAATWEGLATESGHMTEKLSAIYEELAKGGIGTIITGYANICQEEQANPFMLGIYEDSFIPEYKIFTESIHRYGANIIMQIAYGGTMTSMEVPNHTVFGPSIVKNEITEIIPKEMSKEDISYLVKMHGNAAKRVKLAGFDGVEIHAAHGYLVSQFLSPHYNQRNDEYGGSIENRARLLVEIIREVRKNLGDEFPIIVKLNTQDFIPDGMTSEESLFVAKMLENIGVDAIELSGGDGSSRMVRENNLTPSRTKVAVAKENESYFKEHGKNLSNTVSIPVILTGGNRSLDIMDGLLNENGISYFGMARPLICEPNLIKKWEKDTSSTAKCVSCNQCFNTIGKRCILNK